MGQRECPRSAVCTRCLHPHEEVCTPHPLGLQASGFSYPRASNQRDRTLHPDQPRGTRMRLLVWSALVLRLYAHYLRGWTCIHAWSVCVCACVYQQYMPSLATASTWGAGGAAASLRAGRFGPAPAVQPGDILSTTTLFAAPHQGTNTWSNKEVSISILPMTSAKGKKPDNQYFPNININTSL